MEITMAAHPSPYAELLTTSSIGGDIGTTAPCKTGLARTGILRLGNKLGRRECSAVPMVWVWVPLIELRGLLDVDVIAIGGRGDCKTLSDGDPESGGRGRNIRIGTLRND